MLTKNNIDYLHMKSLVCLILYINNKIADSFTKCIRSFMLVGIKPERNPKTGVGFACFTLNVVAGCRGTYSFANQMGKSIYTKEINNCIAYHKSHRFDKIH